MTKLIEVKQQTQNKYLNMFDATYENEKGKFNYYIASRKNLGELVVQTSKKVPDAIRVIPYFKDKNTSEIFLVLIREHRFAINDLIYSVPAGLIDDGETPYEACARELFEETGAKAISITQTDDASFSLAGVTDELVVSFEAEVVPSVANHIQDNEVISTEIIKLDDLLEFLDNNNVGLITRFQLREFYYKQKFLQTQQAKNNLF